MQLESVLVRFYDCVLEVEAQTAVERASEGVQAGDKKAVAGGAFTAIVAAAASTEFYLSEILAHLEQVGRLKAKDRDAIRKQPNVWQRFQRLAKEFRKPIEQEPFYREYQALVTLRNCLIHRSADFLRPNEWPGPLENYRTTIPHAQGGDLAWTSQLLTVETAKWATEVARSFLAEMHRRVPDPAFMSMRTPEK